MKKSVVFISAIAGFIILVAIGIIVFSLVNSEETFVYFETDGGTIIQPLRTKVIFPSISSPPQPRKVIFLRGGSKIPNLLFR